MKRRTRPAASVRTRHDEWTKRAFALWLSALGDVELDARIAGESRRGDVLYTERHRKPAHRRRLGMLGELARGHVLFEPFRNPCTARELRSCVLKAADLGAREARAARRAKKPLSSVKEPLLCVITPTMSREIREEAGVKRLRDRARGLHTLSPMWNTVVVVVHELPQDRSTVWLRLLGRGRVQARAVRELEAMSQREPLRDATMELLVTWLQGLPPAEQQAEEDRELRMNLERVYERWERKTLARGRAEGMAEGKREGKTEGKANALLAVLEGRGLPVTAAQRKLVLGCTSDKQLDAWLRVAGTTPSARELLGAPARRTRRA